MRNIVGATACSYELDERLIIRGLGPGWDETAIQNEAIELLAPAPVGQPLFNYVSDATTVHIYELLFQRARACGATAFPIRCDAPDVRRYLTVRIVPRPAGFLVLTQLTRAEIRPRIDILVPHAARSHDVLSVCGWCKRAHATGRWVELEEAVRSLRLFERPQQPRVAHAICNACHRFMSTMLADDSKLPSL